MNKLETIRIAGNLIGLFYKDHHEYMTGQQLAELINKQSEELELADTTLQLVRLETIKQNEIIKQIHAKLDRLLPEVKVRLDKCPDVLKNKLDRAITEEDRLAARDVLKDRPSDLDNRTSKLVDSEGNVVKSIRSSDNWDAV